MAQDFTKVTINQIDMDAVTETVIAKGNLVYRTDHSDTKAEDVDKRSEEHTSELQSQ